MLRAIPGLLVQMSSGEILTLGWVLAIISRLVAGGWGEKPESTLLGGRDALCWNASIWEFGFLSPFIFLRNRHVSHSVALFRDTWIYNVQVEVSSPLQSVKNSFFVHLFLSSTPSLNIFCKFILDNPRISGAGFSFTFYLACSVTLAETTNLIHDVNSKL